MSEEKRIIINTYDEAINHINHIKNTNKYNDKTIYLRYCDLSNFVDENYDKNCFSFAELLKLLGLEYNKKENFYEVHDKIDCSHSIFPLTTFAHIKFNKDIFLHGTVFLGELNFYLNHFNCNKIDFTQVTLENGVWFQPNTVIKELSCDLSFSTIQNHLTFNTTISNICFYKSKFFNAEIDLVEKINKLNLSECLIDESSKLTLRNNVISSLSLENSTIKGKLNFLSEISSLNADKTIIQGFLFISNGSNIKNVENRYTARLLKNECIKNNDIITSNHFRRLEMNKYQEELKKMKSSIPNYPSDRCILILNNISNQHGQNFIRGILFTILVAIGGFFLFSLLSSQIELTINFSSIGEYWKNTLQYLWVPDTSALKESNIGFWSTLVYIIGKIGITYGIYQTIAAFRKYNLTKG